MYHRLCVAILQFDQTYWWIFCCCCCGHPCLFNKLLQMCLLMTTKILTNSAKNMPRSAKIKQRIDKHKTASATCRNESWNAEPPKWGGGSVTPHGVFHISEYIYPLRARTRTWRVCLSKNSFLSVDYFLFVGYLQRILLLCRFSLAGAA